MKPTKLFRWLKIHEDHIDQIGIRAQDTNFFYVLQQKWVEEYAFNGGPVPGGKEEWRNIPVEIDDDTSTAVTSNLQFEEE